MRKCWQSPICVVTWTTLLLTLPKERCAYKGTQHTQLGFTSRHILIWNFNKANADVQGIYEHSSLFGGVAIWRHNPFF